MSTPAYTAVTPYLTASDAAKTIEFYKTAFGAEERYRLTSEEGRVGHCELTIGDQVIMIADEFPGMNTSPKSLGGVTTQFVLMVPNADAAYEKALAAGAESIRPPSDQFYGYRMALVRDPSGHQWMIQHAIEQIEPAEMQKRWNAMVAECSGKAQA